MQPCMVHYVDSTGGIFLDCFEWTARMRARSQVIYRAYITGSTINTLRPTSTCHEVHGTWLGRRLTYCMSRDRTHMHCPFKYRSIGLSVRFRSVIVSCNNVCACVRMLTARRMFIMRLALNRWLDEQCSRWTQREVD